MIGKKMIRNLGGVVGILVFSNTTQASIACDAGQQYYQIARKAGAALNFNDAERWLRKSLSSCESYEAWHLLGTAYKRQNKLNDALNAYKKAVSAAETADNAALSLGRYGQALALNGQRYEALATLEQAIELHTAAPQWLRDSARKIDHDLLDKPISEQSIKRSLSAQEFGLISVKAFGFEKETQRDIVTGKLRIPINYKYNSVELDTQTADNIRELGKALAAEDFATNTFTLVGHADVRGDENYNLGLSYERASAVKSLLIMQFPSLEGRLSVRGEGERQPKYPGANVSEKDHRLNRRLEVLVR
jgi:outer membrane protein OmpA-like peptidoglycan-associated protein